MTGLGHAGGEYVFLIDSDNQIPLDEFEPLWSAVSAGKDAAFGVRRIRHDAQLRKLLTVVIRRSLSLMFGVRLYDSNVPYKLLRRALWTDASALIPDGHAGTVVVPGGLRRAARVRHRLRRRHAQGSRDRDRLDPALEADQVLRARLPPAPRLPRRPPRLVPLSMRIIVIGAGPTGPRRRLAPRRARTRRLAAARRRAACRRSLDVARGRCRFHLGSRRPRALFALPLLRPPHGAGTRRCLVRARARGVGLDARTLGPVPVPEQHLAAPRRRPHALPRGTGREPAGAGEYPARALRRLAAAGVWSRAVRRVHASLQLQGVGARAAHDGDDVDGRAGRDRRPGPHPAQPRAAPRRRELGAERDLSLSRSAAARGRSGSRSPRSCQRSALSFGRTVVAIDTARAACQLSDGTEERYDALVSSMPLPRRCGWRPTCRDLPAVRRPFRPLLEPHRRHRIRRHAAGGAAHEVLDVLSRGAYSVLSRHRFQQLLARTTSPAPARSGR